jgi:hypothetical protein
MMLLLDYTHDAGYYWIAHMMLAIIGSHTMLAIIGSHTRCWLLLERTHDAGVKAKSRRRREVHSFRTINAVTCPLLG